jgi:fatty acid amide hydrolase 2
MTGALLGSGASIFGLGSDIGGSIRMPGLFNGVFGHKPTAGNINRIFFKNTINTLFYFPGLISLDGHFPNSPDENFQKYLTIGPMVRFGKCYSYFI